VLERNQRAAPLDGAGTYLWGVTITDDSNENASYVVFVRIRAYLNPV